MARAITDQGTLTAREQDPATQEPVVALGIKDKALAYFALTKPRIIELLLVTTIPPMIVAERGMPSMWLMFATLFGGALGAGGANAINCYVDRDIDQLMTRTKRRPLPLHKVEPLSAVVFGTVLGVLAFFFLWATVNLLSAGLVIAALLFYVFVYTIGMKRWTPQNIVIGGAAGAAPALVGWSAVTGTVEMPALVMFAIVFYWTPPHFWALSLRYEKEYAAAGVPMMPVVYGKVETSKHILLYTFLLFAMCLALYSVAQLGLFYLGSALVLNGFFVWYSVKLYRKPQPRVAWGLFKYSIYYLALLFISAAVDVLIAA